VVVGSKQAVNESTRCATGSTSATRWIQSGAPVSGKNTPERKMTGNIVMLATAGADSALETKVETASPSALSAVPPSTRVTSAAGISRGSIETPKNAMPTTTSSTTLAIPETIAEIAQAPR